MATVTVNGQTIYYTRPMKAPDGSVLLLIHGAGGSHLDWPREIQRLPGISVYNLDLPGHGRSTGPGRSSVDGYADVVQTFIEVMGLQAVTIAGHSMGGAIAQSLALRKLPQMTRMIIINSSARLRVAPVIMDAALAEPESVVDFVARWSWGEGAAENLINQGKQSMMRTNPAVLHADFLACDRFDVRSKLHQIRIPTLVISSTEDKMTPLRYGRYLAENIADGRLVIIEDAGHFAMLERPKIAADAIADFLRTETS